MEVSFSFAKAKYAVVKAKRMSFTKLGKLLSYKILLCFANALYCLSPVIADVLLSRKLTL
eukprot:snap_masked-scaffold_4-processed-gene-15.11-mRNA-1 protein AED:1.00 eAED:1.00 QI:0/0/0/0/1/1/2/0/59